MCRDGGRRGAWPVLLGLLLGAPLAAEHSHAYLPSTGDPVAVAFEVLFFVPLYGAAAVLVREAAVRAGRGWSGRLLLAAAFGLAMTALIDTSLFMRDRPDIAYWASIQETTRIPALGIAAYPLTTWVAGHVILSVGGPLAVAEAVGRPADRDRPWLSPLGLGVLAALFVAAAVAVHLEETARYAVRLSPGQWLGATVAIAGLVGLALGPPGRPRRQVDPRPAPAPVLVLVVSGAGMAAYASAPPTWVGTTWIWVVLVAAGALLRRYGSRAGWGPRHGAAVAVGVLSAQLLIALTGPLPEGVSGTARLAHCATLGLVVTALALLAWRRTARS